MHEEVGIRLSVLRRPRWIALLALGVGTAALALLGPLPALGKEFVLDGTVVCDVESGRVCSLTGNMLRVLTDDISGTKQIATIDISWLKDNPAFHQDELVCLSVDSRPDGGLQALGLIQPCPPEEPTPEVKEEEEKLEKEK